MYRISNLLDIPKMGVYAIANPISRKVYIGYSISMLGNLAGIVDELRIGGYRISQMNKDRSVLEFIVLEQGSDIETLKLHATYWTDRYKDSGWELYDPAKRKYLEYKVEIVISLDAETSDVVLVNTRGDHKIVGRFDNVLEAEDFVNLYYNKDVNRYNYPIYASNSLTKEFIVNGIRGII